MNSVARQNQSKTFQVTVDAVADEYDRLCSAMDSFPWYRDRRTLQLINNSVPATCRRGLDIGCGTGIVIKYLAEKRSDIQWTGIDRAPEMIAATRAKCEGIGNVIAQEMDWIQLTDQFKLGTFDFILVKNVLHLVNNVIGNLSILPRILTPTGRILLVETVSPNNESKKFVYELSRMLEIIGLKKHIFTSRELVRFVRGASLEIQKILYENQFIEVKKWLDAKSRSSQMSDDALAYLQKEMRSEQLRNSMKFESPSHDFPGRMLRRQMLIQCVPHRDAEAVSG